MEHTLFELIKLYKEGDEKAFELLLLKMTPIIKKYSYLLKDDTYINEFYFFLYKLIDGIKIESFAEEDGEYKLLAYVKKSIYHKYIEFSKQKQKQKNKECDLNCDIKFTVDFDNLFMNVEISQAIDNLTEKQKRVVILIFYYGYNESEVAKILKISKQAVNRLKHTALNTLKKEFNA